MARSRLAEGRLRATSIAKGFWLAIVCIARGDVIVEGLEVEVAKRMKSRSLRVASY